MARPPLAAKAGSTPATPRCSKPISTTNKAFSNSKTRCKCVGEDSPGTASAGAEAVSNAGAFTRRRLGLAAACLATGTAINALAATAADFSSAPAPQPAAPTLDTALSGSQHPLDTELAAAFTAATYAAVEQLQVMPEAEFQAAAFKLRQREWAEYAAAVNAASSSRRGTASASGGEQAGEAAGGGSGDALPAIPDLTDMGGLLNNPLYFNFINYVLLKVAVQRLARQEERDAFLAVAGQQLAQRTANDALQAAQTLARKGRGKASTRQLLDCVSTALLKLQAGGYLQEYELAWVPAQPPPVRPLGEAAEERGGAMAQGPGQQGPDASLAPVVVLHTGSTAQAYFEGSDARADGGRLRVVLERPADLSGAMALKEEEGVWGSLAGPMLAAVVGAAGYEAAAAAQAVVQEPLAESGGVAGAVFYGLVDPLFLAPALEMMERPTKVVVEWLLL